MGKYTPLIGLSIAHFTNDFYQFVLPLLLPFFIQELGLSYLSSGALVAVYLGAGVLFNPVIGHFADVHRKRKLVLCLGLALYSIFAASLCLARDYPTLLVISILMGFGFSVYHPQATKFISANYGKNLGKMMGLHGIGGGAGFFATPMLLVPLIYALGWRSAVSLIFIPGTLAAIMLWRILREPETKPAKTLPKIVMRPIVLLAAISGFGYFVFRGFTTFLPAYFVAAQGATVLEMGLLTSFVMGAAIVAEPVGGYISDIIGRKQTFVITMALLMLSLLVFTNTSGLISLLSLAMVGFWAQCTRPVGLTFAYELAPAERAGMAVGIVFGGATGISLTSAVVIGYLIDVSGFYWSFMALAVFAGFAAVLSMFLPRVNPNGK